MSVDHTLDDDGLELYTSLPSSSKSRPPGRGRRWLVASAALLIGGAVLAGLTMFLIAQLPSNPAAQQEPASAPAGAGTATGSQTVLGVTMPLSEQHGPSIVSDQTAAGFARTPEGAALAAAHLSVRSDPYAGPAYFGPVLRKQATGPDRATALAAAKKAHAAVAAGAGVDPGDPIPAATGQLLGWRIEDFQRSAVNQVLLLVAAGDEDVVFRVPVVWADGDWRLRPTVSREGLVQYQLTTPAAGDRFTAFFGEES